MTRRRFSVHPDLLADVTETFDYYRQIDDTLATRFLTSRTHHRTVRDAAETACSGCGRAAA